MIHDATETLDADIPIADVVVPVLEGAERILRIVEVQDEQPVQTNDSVELLHHRIHIVDRSDVVPGSECVTCVEADADSLLRLDLIDDCRQLLERPPECRPLTRRCFKARNRLDVRQRIVHPVQRLGETTDALFNPAPGVCAGVRHQILNRQLVAPLELVLECRHGLFEEIVLRRCKVDQVRIVDHHLPDAGAFTLLMESLDDSRVQRFRTPLALILGENLGRRCPDIDRALKRLVDATSRRRVGSEIE